VIYTHKRYYYADCELLCALRGCNNITLSAIVYRVSILYMYIIIYNNIYIIYI